MKLTALACGLLFGGMGLFLFKDAPANLLHLWVFSRGLQDLKHPPDSALLDSHSAYGLLDGNGNHCDFFAGELRTSALPREELRKWYASGPAKLSFPGEDRLATHVSTWRQTTDPRAYFVYLFTSEEANDDIRCH